MNAGSAHKSATGSATVDLVLPEQITIENSEALHHALGEVASRSNGNVSLDASAVRMMTTSGLQLLVSLRKTLQSQGRGLEIVGLHPSCLELFASVGLESLLSMGKDA